MLTEEDATWLLENLPLELVRFIIASYNPECFFIMDKQWLSKYNWDKQCKATFDLPFDSIYAYYNLCQKFRKLDAQIICGYLNTFIMHQGVVMGCGDNTHQQLCLEKKIMDTTKFEKIISGDYVQTGKMHTIILKNGRVMVCGCNYYGQLGLGDLKKRSEFIEISNLSNIIKIASRSNGTFIMKDDGTIMSCGSNSNGQLGLGDKITRREFVEIQGLPKDVVQIECGEYHTVILRSNGVVMGCGSNDIGQLGLETYYDKVTFQEIDLPKDIVQISSNGNHTFVLRANGELMSCGHNYFGQLGHGDHKKRRKFETVKGLPKDIVQVVCGHQETIILRADGTLMGCGRMMTDAGKHTFEEIEVPKDIIQISCGYCHVMIMRANGDLLIRGYNISGQLGVGDTEDRQNFEKLTI